MNHIDNCKITNETDSNGNPTGGSVQGVGLQIEWQNGPLGQQLTSDQPEPEPNGAFVETVLSAAKQRLDFYQGASGGKFACRENALAITKIEEALHWLEARTKRRVSAGVEGTHNVAPGDGRR